MDNVFNTSVECCLFGVSESNLWKTDVLQVGGTDVRDSKGLFFLSNFDQKKKLEVPDTMFMLEGLEFSFRRVAPTKV